MKKKFGIFLAIALVLVCIFTITAFAEETTEDTITISYMNTQETTSDTTSLDTTAYSDGKQTVGKGESFTLPTTSSNSYTGQDGFQLIWYTENGRTYKAGETVSFTEDTKLFRCVAKECYTMTDVNYAMANESTAAILMADIDAATGISVKSEGQSVLILNGFTINISKNSGNFMGSQRSGKHIYGEGTINASSPDGKVGSYYFFEDKSHSHNGGANKTVIGVDVTINAPNLWMASDGDGAYNNHYPWTRIYGNVNFYGLYSISNTGNRAPFVEVFDGATVTITGPTLFKDISWRGKNELYTFNHQAFELRIYGGTFYLPAEAATEEFWTNDNKADYLVGTTNYCNYGLTKNTQDVIKIFGGSFVLPDNAVPAIADYLTTDWIGSIPNGGSGLVTNNNTSTYYVAYMNRPGYKLAFEKYTIADDAYGKLTVTDYIDGSLTGTYYYQMTTGTIEFVDPYYAVYDTTKQNITQNTIESIIVYELNSETNEYTVTDKFELGFAMGGAVMFKNSITEADNKLQNLEANETTYQVVVPAACEHNFEGAPVDATCEHGAYADYNCSVCGHNVYFSWGTKLDHNYVLGTHVQATSSSLGSKSYTCSMCNNSLERVYSLDPTSLEIAVTIRNDDDTLEEITVLASEIFEFATAGSGGDYIYTLSAIKAFGDYSIRNIYGITIPQGILYMNITTENKEKYNNVEYGVAVLTFAEGAKIQVQNIGNLRKVETIVVKENADVTFAPSCSYYSPNNEKRDMQKIATIDLSAGNHTVTFMSQAFDSRGQIATLTFGENATYNFGHKAFYNCAILELAFIPSSEFNFTGSHAFYGNDMTELVLPDNFDISFASNTFENCPNLTTVTFGTGSTYSIGNYCFAYCPIIKVALTGGSDYTIGEKAFMNTALAELDMSAGNMNVTFKNSAFNCWHNNVLYCTLSTITFGENSTYVLSDSSFNHASIETLKLAGNSTYTFNQYAFNGDTTKALLTTIDMSADNITATFNWRAFYQRTILTSIIFGENGNYTFNSNTFEGTPIGDITLASNSTCVFNSSWINSSSTITKLDASADNLNVTFDKNAFKDRTTLTTLLINGKNSTYDFKNQSFYNTGVTELVFGEGSTYTFASYPFSNTKIASIDATASNVTATFNESAFNGMSALEYLNFGKNSTYVIGKNAFVSTNPINDIVFSNTSTFEIGYRAFYDTDFASVKFEDNVGETQYVTFTSTEAFNACTAKELYIGKNIAIKNYPFKNFKALEKLVIMDGVTHASEWEFENAGSADFTTPLVVYNHSYDLAFNKGLFNNCDGIVLYTVTDNIGTRNDVFVNCADVKDADGNLLYAAWTVYLGIPHPVVDSFISDPTCTEEGVTGWISDKTCCDCDFKITEEKVVNKYENEHNIKDTTVPINTTIYSVVIAPALGHNAGIEAPEILAWVYENNNFFINARYQHLCQTCEKYYLGIEIENTALFTMRGSSSQEGENADALSHTIIVNLDAVALYNEYLGEGNEIKYGMLAGIAKDGSDNKVLTADGTIRDNEAVVSARVDGTDYSLLQLKITNITNPDQALYCSAFVIINNEVYYIFNGAVSDSATVISLNEPEGIKIDETVASNLSVEAIVDNKETIYA